jgi:GNAT superfamily N-acetyltransferase
MQLELIRIQTKEHYQAAADLTNTLYDNHVYSAEQGLHELANANPPASFLYQLAYIDARAVAFFECSEPETGHFWLEILVHPDFQRQGIGSRLMLEALNHIQKFAGTHVEVQIRSDWAAHDKFYAKHGFERSTAWVKWWLKPKNLNHQSNVQVKSLAELEQPIDNTALLELINELRFAANQSEPSKTYTLEMLNCDVFGAMWFKPERFWVVFDQQNLVAASWVAGFKNDPTLFLEFLGVRASARSRGIGSAFVAKMVEVCQQHNFEGIEAHCHPDETVTNTFLKHRGFEQRPGYLLVKKNLV